MDREKVIKGLECHRIDNNHRINCADCPYYVDDDNHIRCVNDLHDDALSLLKEQEGVINELQSAYGYLQKQFFEAQEKLLKEQEAVEPYVTGRGETFETAETWWYACGNCHEALDVNDNYCRHCGKPMLWEGR